MEFTKEKSIDYSLEPYLINTIFTRPILFQRYTPFVMVNENGEFVDKKKELKITTRCRYCNSFTNDGSRCCLEPACSSCIVSNSFRCPKCKIDLRFL